MQINVNKFFPADIGLMRQRETYFIVLDIIKENEFRLISHSDNIKECVFEKDNKQYKLDRMEYWTFSKTGEIGLDIDYIRMECITEAV